MAKAFDLTKFRKTLTKSIDGLGIGFNDPTDWVSTGNYALNYLISGDFNKGIPLGKVTVFAGESGAGKSVLARKSNNHFGIVGKNPHYRSRYRYFKSDTASYEGFCKLICNKSFYRKLAGTDDAHQWILAISNAGYAENATAWRHKILAIIKRNELS